jgi:hypothetical protein
MKKIILALSLAMMTSASYAQALDDNWDTVIDKLNKEQKTYKVQDSDYFKYIIVTESDLTYEKIYAIRKEQDQLELISFIFYDAMAYSVWIEQIEKNMIEISNSSESRKWYSKNMVKGKKICFLIVNPSDDEVQSGIVGKLRISYAGSVFNNPY